jgi:cation:H+ antiporter
MTDLSVIATILLGLAGLWAGTELVIRSSLRIARNLGLSELFVGLVILSIGTDLPEIAVAVEVGIRNIRGNESSGIIIGTSIGSAFGQIGFVMALLGMGGYLTLGKKYIHQHGSVMLGSILVLMLVGWDGMVTRVEGFLMLILYAMYLIMVSQQAHVPDIQRSAAGSNDSAAKPWIILIAGISLLVFSSDMTVGAVYVLATDLGISQTLIAILLIGFGTSLPELAISVGALLRKRTGLSVGNLIGSNILDILVPIGLSAAISPLIFDRSLLWFDLPVLFLLSLVVLALFLRKRGLQRREAVLIMLIYFSYVIAKLGFA